MKRCVYVDCFYCMRRVDGGWTDLGWYLRYPGYIMPYANSVWGFDSLKTSRGAYNRSWLAFTVLEGKRVWNLNCIYILSYSRIFFHSVRLINLFAQIRPFLFVGMLSWIHVLKLFLFFTGFVSSLPPPSLPSLDGTLAGAAVSFCGHYILHSAKLRHGLKG